MNIWNKCSNCNCRCAVSRDNLWMIVCGYTVLYDTELRHVSFLFFYWLYSSEVNYDLFSPNYFPFLQMLKTIWSGSRTREHRTSVNCCSIPKISNLSSVEETSYFGWVSTISYRWIATSGFHRRRRSTNVFARVNHPVIATTISQFSTRPRDSCWPVERMRLHRSVDTTHLTISATSSRREPALQNRRTRQRPT